MTLDEFIKEQQQKARRFERGQHVEEDGFSTLYVRMNRLAIPHLRVSCEPGKILDIASVEVTKPGRGTFSRLLQRLRHSYPDLGIYVENAHPRFGKKLQSLGFIQADNYGPPVKFHSWFFPGWDNPCLQCGHQAGPYHCHHCGAT